MLSGRAGVSSGQAARGVVWAGVGLGEEVVARQHKLPIGAHRKEELERRSSMDIRHPQWSMAGRSRLTTFRGPLVAQTSMRRLAQPCEAGAASGRKAPVTEAIRRSSSPGVVVPDSACHAGGRGFESRRSRSTKPLQTGMFSCLLRRDKPSLKGSFAAPAHAKCGGLLGEPLQNAPFGIRLSGAKTEEARKTGQTLGPRSPSVHTGTGDRPRAS
jgi:hypothetical protein